MLIGSVLILVKKITSRGPVHPIPIPSNLQPLNNQGFNLDNSQPDYQSDEVIELQEIPSISGVINAAITDENLESISDVNETEEYIPISPFIIMRALVNENTNIIPSVSQILDTPSVNENVNSFSKNSRFK